MRTTEVVGKVREGNLVRENDEATESHISFPVGMIDWELLAKQKHVLINMLADRDNHILHGLVALIDEIQDRASSAGHPVVWFREEE